MTITQREALETLSVYIDRLLSHGAVHPTRQQLACVKIGCDFLASEINKVENPLDKVESASL